MTKFVHRNLPEIPPLWHRWCLAEAAGEAEGSGDGDVFGDVEAAGEVEGSGESDGKKLL